jgi:hypothetical protein
VIKPQFDSPINPETRPSYAHWHKAVHCFLHALASTLVCPRTVTPNLIAL